MLKRLIFIGFVLISAIALLTSNVSAGLGGWGGTPAWSLRGAIDLSGAGNLSKGDQLVTATISGEVEFICRGPQGQVTGGTSSNPGIPVTQILGPDDTFGKGQACLEFYFPWVEDNSYCQSSNLPHMWWTLIPHSDLMPQFRADVVWYRCNDEELDGHAGNDDDSPCWECCDVDENGEPIIGENGLCEGTWENGVCSSVYFTYKRVVDKKSYQCTLPPGEYRYPEDTAMYVDITGEGDLVWVEEYQIKIDYDFVAEYNCCELDTNGEIIEETCADNPSTCDAYY